MSNPHSSGPTPPRNQLADEAADWFARMRGPEAEANREAFEQWLRRGALHRAAYNRVAEIFAMGKRLQNEAPPASKKPPRWGAALPLLAAGLIPLSLSLAWWSLREAPEKMQEYARTNDGVIKTGVGDVRMFTLPDGSRITLDTDSQLAFALDDRSRDLRLLRGRARFDVAHDGRPFLVHAGRGTVLARGTIFDVRLLEGDRMAVRLLKGKIDVGRERERPSDPVVGVRRMMPGEAMIFAAGVPSPQGKARDADAHWPEGRYAASDTKLATILAEANRFGGVQIVAGDATILELRVSGDFAIDNPEALAKRLAVVFDLELDTGQAGRIILRRRETTKK